MVIGRFSGESMRRLAIYDHYDVQPPEPLEDWSVPPFEAVIKDGRFYARGVADNKGNLVARLWAVRAWREVYGVLPCGVTFLVEGEEEIGSPSLGRLPAIIRNCCKLMPASGKRVRAMKGSYDHHCRAKRHPQCGTACAQRRL